MDPAGGEDKGLPLGASPPGGLRISHQLGMVLVSQFSAEVGIYARIRVHPPSSWGGVDSGSTFMSMWYLRARLQVGGSTSLQVGVLVVEPIGLPGYLVSWPWYHLAT